MSRKEKLEKELAETEHDLKILESLSNYKRETAEIEDIEDDSGYDFYNEIIPIIHKYDLHVHIVGSKEFTWKSRIKDVVKDLDKKREELREKLERESLLKSMRREFYNSSIRILLALIPVSVVIVAQLIILINTLIVPNYLEISVSPNEFVENYEGGKTNFEFKIKNVGVDFESFMVEKISIYREKDKSMGTLETRWDDNFCNNRAGIIGGFEKGEVCEFNIDAYVGKTFFDDKDNPPQIIIYFETNPPKIAFERVQLTLI